MASQHWTKLEDSDIPTFTIASMTNYFVTRIVSDGKPANDFKSLNAHAYPLFKAGHIQSIYTTHTDTSHNYDKKYLFAGDEKRHIIHT